MDLNTVFGLMGIFIKNIMHNTDLNLTINTLFLIILIMLNIILIIYYEISLKINEILLLLSKLHNTTKPIILVLHLFNFKIDDIFLIYYLEAFYRFIQLKLVHT